VFYKDLKKAADLKLIYKKATEGALLELDRFEEL
jgi:hypothetical protein